jgi:cytoskeletal protein RodZ
MPAENFKVGQYLKGKREEQKISLDDIARVTKITPTYLRYLEADELHRHLEPIFHYGYLRSYAKLLHLDGDEILARYKSSMKPELKPAPVPPKPESVFTSYSRLMVNSFVDFIWTVLGASPSFSVGKTVLPPKH